MSSSEPRRSSRNGAPQAGDFDAGDATRPGRPSTAGVRPDVDLDTTLAAVGNKLAVGQRFEEYEISGVLGEGGFGIVYLAWDHSLHRQLAIKEYMPASLARRTSTLQIEVKDASCAAAFDAGLRSFVNEAKLLARFDHPALLKVHRFWQANGTAYMAMPFYEGVTLKRALAARPDRPDEAWLRKLLAPLLDALEYMHAASCYHRDIAPDNIMLLDDGRPLLLDFGAARRLIGDINKAITVILKAGYAPIEQYGETPGLPQGPWTDIYALGAVLHFAITGTVPRASVARMLGDSQEPLAKRLKGRYSDRLLRAIDRMLAVQPKDRPQSIAEVRALLDPTPAPARDRDGAARRWRAALGATLAGRRMRTFAVPVVLVGAGLVAALVGFQHLARRAEPAASPAVVEVPAAPPSPAPTTASAEPPAAPAALPSTAEPVPAVVEPPTAAAVAPPAPDPATVAPATVAAPGEAVPPAADGSPTPAVAESLPAAAPSATAAVPTTPAPQRAAAATTRPPRDEAMVAAAPRRAAPPRPPPTARKLAPRMRDTAQCIDIIQRVSIGEPLTAEDRRILNEECRP